MKDLNILKPPRKKNCTMTKEIKARRWNMHDWYTQTRRWMEEPAVNIDVSISPDIAEACEPNTWTITIKTDEVPLREGSHISIEIPITWKTDLGRPFYPRDVEDLVLCDRGKPGYGSFVSISASKPEVQIDAEISHCSRFDIIDIAIVKGILEKGETIQVILGSPESSKLRCQKHAQKAILATGVDLEGNGVYRRVEKEPEVNVVGGYAASLRVVAPAVVERSEPFELTIIAVDSYNQNPASNYAGKVELSFSTAESQIPEECIFNGNSISKVSPCFLKKEGFFYALAIDRENGLIGKSNPIYSSGSPEYKIFFGDIHGQTYESIGTGDIDEYYRWGRDVECLDFCATANHYGGRCKVTDEIWNRVVEGSNRYYKPGKFVTFISFEWGGEDGHKNVYYRSNTGQFYPSWDPNYNTPEKLWKALKDKGAFTIPHHTKYCRVTNWSYRNDEMQRLVEICSGWGISETGGKHSIQNALAMGHRLGFIGGTDTHFGQPGHGSFGVNEGRGLAAVYAKELTREAVWWALYNRHCYATTGERIILDFKVNGQRMGKEITVRKRKDMKIPREIYVRAAGTSKIKTVEIIRNNEVIFSRRGDETIIEFVWRDEEDLNQLAIPPTFPYDCPFVFYYARITQENRQKAWSSPVWFNLHAYNL